MGELRGDSVRKEMPGGSCREDVWGILPAEIFVIVLEIDVREECPDSNAGQVSTRSGYDLCHSVVNTQTHRQLFTGYTNSSAS